mmetsp:Transcript_63432/g.205998  ORF Transcript_63432/g.205998 Transcript_63432/m.205998 type:complete len:1180 (-) Transcript_63432:35-3574(-)
MGGCCGSDSIPQEIDAEVYGQVVQMRPGRYFEKGVGPAIEGPSTAKVIEPGKGATRVVGWQRFEFDFNWMPEQGKPKAQASEGKVKWSKSHAKAMDNALLSTTEDDLRCGREQLLFAGLMSATFPSQGTAKVDKVAGVALLSTGRLFIMNIKKKTVHRSCHLFDIRKVTATAGSDEYSMSLDFDAAALPFQGPKCAALASNTGPVSLQLKMTSQQATDLLSALSRLHLVLRASKLDAEAPDAMPKFTLPAPPCDGGFLSLFYATCSYVGTPISEVHVGKQYFESVPYLELDATGFEPLNAVAAAIRVGMEKSAGMRGFVRRARPIQDAAFKQLLPMFRRGTLMKVHLPSCGLTGVQLSQLFDAFKAPGFNPVVDMDFSGNAFDTAARDGLIRAIEAIQGSVRALALRSVSMKGEMWVPLLKAIGARASKLERLDLSGNAIGAVRENAHPLASIWNPRLEILNISKTGMELEKIIGAVQQKDIQALRILGMAELAFPAAAFQRLAALLPPTFQRIDILGVAKSSLDFGALFAALASSQAAANLELGFEVSEQLRGEFTTLLDGLSMATATGKIPGSVDFDSGRRAAACKRTWTVVEPKIADAFLKAAKAGLTGGAAMDKVAKDVNQIIRAGTADAVVLDKFANLVGSLQVAKLGITGNDKEASATNAFTANVSLFSGPDIGGKAGLILSKVGFGPELALVIPGIAKNRSTLELDLTDATGGDAVALALGVALKENRTLRSLHVTGNYFSHHGLAAVRSALYGNKKLVEFPFPQADAQEMITRYQAAMKQCGNSVLQCRGKIKMAFKSTKGRRTPYVNQTLDSQVSEIKVYKTREARFRLTIAKYAKVQQEIQEAIARNQKDAKNLELEQKLQNKETNESWKAATKALGNVNKFQEEKAQQQTATQQGLWTKRQEVAKAWLTKKSELKKHNKAAPWLDSWVINNTKEGDQLIVTKAAAEFLLLRVPTDQASQFKAEVKLTTELVKFEQELDARQQLLNCKIEEAKLQVNEIKMSPCWVAPMVNSPPGFMNSQQAKVLATPVPLKAAAPPPGVIQARVIAVGSRPTAGPVIQGHVVQGEPASKAIVGTPVAVCAPSATVQQAQYEQWRVYQQQQEFQEQRFHQQVQQKTQQQQTTKQPWWKFGRGGGGGTKATRTQNRRDDRHYDDGYGYGGYGGYGYDGHG